MNKLALSLAVRLMSTTTTRFKKHERTRQDKEDDRTRHMLMLKAQTGPVFLTYRRRAEIVIKFLPRYRLSHCLT
jgi:uncharacterized protein (DUF1015 family)